MRTDTAPMVVASSGSHKVVGPNTKEKSIMFKKLMLATIASLVLVGGAASAAPAANQQFNVVISGDISANLGSGPIQVSKNQSNVSFQCTPLCTPFVLEDFWQHDNYTTGPGGSTCFPVGTVTGAVATRETKGGDASATFWFSSDETGSHIRYMLTLTDSIGWIGIFPPPGKNDTATMIASGWKMETEGKGQHRNSACKGMGGDAYVELVVKRTD
jgi:hypothetical protein